MFLPFKPSTLETSGKSPSKLLTLNSRPTNEFSNRYKRIKRAVKINT